MKKSNAPPPLEVNEGKHTPGKLEIVDKGDPITPSDYFICIKPEADKKYSIPICEVTAGSLNKDGKANAARIVECWNGYDGLKKENERLNKSIDGLLETGGSKLSNQQYQLLKAENEKVKNWWHEAQELAGQMTKVASEHEKEIEALRAANRELLKELNQFVHSVEHEGVINGRVARSVENAKKTISKHSKQTT